MVLWSRALFGFSSNLPPACPSSLCFGSFTSEGFPSSGRTFFKFFIEKVLGTNSLHFCYYFWVCLFVALGFTKRFPMFLSFAEWYFLSGRWEYFPSFSGTYCLCYKAGFQGNSCFPVRSLLFNAAALRTPPPVPLFHRDNLGAEILLLIYLRFLGMSVLSD